MTDYEIPKSQWVSSDTDDVAIHLFWAPGEPQRDLDYQCISTSSFVGPAPEWLAVSGGSRLPVSLGDEVLLQGLFSESSGNTPIARFGHVSRRPGRVPLRSPNATETTAWLVECLAWPGSSGSPAWSLHPANQLIPVSVEGSNTLLLPAFVKLRSFLGLVSGHFGTPQLADVRGDVLGKVSLDLHSGIGVVTTAAAIMDLLERDDVVTERAARLGETGCP
jgi:hypothetical protein